MDLSMKSVCFVEYYKILQAGRVTFDKLQYNLARIELVHSEC